MGDVGTNTIDVSFSTGNIVKTVKPRYQWDKGVVLNISGINPSGSILLHCAFDGQMSPAPIITTECHDNACTARIPDEFFMQPKTIRCYLYVEKDSAGATEYEVRIPIIERAKPSDYLYDPTGAIPNIGELLDEIEAMRDATEKANAVANMQVEAITLPVGSEATAELSDNVLTLGIPQGPDVVGKDGVSIVSIKVLEVP